MIQDERRASARVCMTRGRCVDEVRESLHGGSWELRVRCGMLARERIWMNVDSVGETLEDFVVG